MRSCGMSNYGPDYCNRRFGFGMRRYFGQVSGSEAEAHSQPQTRDLEESI